MEDITNQLDIYCLNFTNNPEEKNERRLQMEQKFDHFYLPVHFYSGVSNKDKSICFVENDNMRRTWSICYGHLDMMNHFINHSKKDYIILCEDDIIIHKEFTIKLPQAIDVMKKHNLDILLIGYLCSNPVDTYSNFPEIDTEYSSETFKIIEYIEDTWGCQMFMITRSHANKMLSKFYHDYAIKTLKDKSLTPFSSDWLLTKNGKRALLYPLLVIENGHSDYEDKGQKNSRINCYNFSFKENTYI
jgi:GR25 family glycosyltransferase involved in LPS biosynthesis